MTIPNETSTCSDDEMITRSEQLSTADVAAATEQRRAERAEASFDADTNAAVERKPADRAERDHQGTPLLQPMRPNNCTAIGAISRLASLTSHAEPSSKPMDWLLM